MFFVERIEIIGVANVVLLLVEHKFSISSECRIMDSFNKWSFIEAELIIIRSCESPLKNGVIPVSFK